MTHCDIARLEEGMEHLVRFFPKRDVHRKPDDTMHDRAPFRRLLDRVRQWYEKIPARRKEFKPALCTSESYDRHSSDCNLLDLCAQVRHGRTAARTYVVTSLEERFWQVRSR